MKWLKPRQQGSTVSIYQIIKKWTCHHKIWPKDYFKSSEILQGLKSKFLFNRGSFQNE
jgi:hypothetical protein